MTPERWREVERVYEAVRERPPAARAAYLAATCGGDAALRAEVESLLAHTSEAERFIEQPAMAAASALEGLSGLTAGQRVGSYQVVGRVGAGGMDI